MSYKNYDISQKILRFISPSYKRKSEMKIIGYGEIPWNLVGDNGSKELRHFSVQFYENMLGDRDYKVLGEKLEVSYVWTKTKAYHDINLWVASGIRPAWFEDILQKKMMS